MIFFAAQGTVPRQENIFLANRQEGIETLQTGPVRVSALGLSYSSGKLSPKNTPSPRGIVLFRLAAGERMRLIQKVQLRHI